MHDTLRIRRHPFPYVVRTNPTITVEIIAWYKKWAKSAALYKMYREVRIEYKMYLEVRGATFCTRYVPLCTFCTGPTQKRALGQGFLSECRCISTPGARVVCDFVGFVTTICPIALFLVGFEPTTCCFSSLLRGYLPAFLLRIVNPN
jgi:hypothetical protein